MRCIGNRCVPAMQLLLSANSQGLLMPPRTGSLPPKVWPKTGDAPPLSRARRSLDLVPSRDASGRPRGHIGNCQTWGRHPCTGKWLRDACVPSPPWWSLWLCPCLSCCWSNTQQGCIPVKLPARCWRSIWTTICSPMASVRHREECTSTRHASHTSDAWQELDHDTRSALTLRVETPQLHWCRFVGCQLPSCPRRWRISQATSTRSHGFQGRSPQRQSCVHGLSGQPHQVTSWEASGRPPPSDSISYILQEERLAKEMEKTRHQPKHFQLSLANSSHPHPSHPSKHRRHRSTSAQPLGHRGRRRGNRFREGQRPPSWPPGSRGKSRERIGSK